MQHQSIALMLHLQRSNQLKGIRTDLLSLQLTKIIRKWISVVVPSLIKCPDIVIIYKNLVSNKSRRGKLPL